MQKLQGLTSEYQGRSKAAKNTATLPVTIKISDFNKFKNLKAADQAALAKEWSVLKMYKKILPSLLTVLVCLLPIVTIAADSPSPEILVTEFQKLPHFEMYCSDESWLRTDSIKVKEKFKSYFSEELYKLFLWAVCLEPEVPPQYNGLKDSFIYDIRFNIYYGNVNYGNKLQVSNLKIHKIKSQYPSKTIVGVSFNYHGTKRSTRYTLIREDSQWKIDDIAPQAGSVDDGSNGYEHSNSIKAAMQNNYNAAMRRYKKEQTQKGAAVE